MREAHPKTCLKIIFEKCVKVYNETNHSFFDNKVAPKDLYNNEPNGDKLKYAVETWRENNNMPRKESSIVFKVGDKVRLSALKRKFEKSSTKTWTDEIFVVCEKRDTNPTTYIVKDNSGNVIVGSMYPQELQLVSDKKD